MTGKCTDMESFSNSLRSYANEENAAKRTAKATTGKATLDETMTPIRKMVEEEKTATGATKEKLKQDIRNQYAESAERTMTPEKEKLTTDLLTDSDVKEYIGQMDYDEYSKLRAEVQGIFGGPQARMIEMQFRNTKIPTIVSGLKKNGTYTQSIENAISDIMGEGVLSEKNLGKMRELENIATRGLDDVITEGTSRATYSRMKTALGEEITNDMFATKIENNFNKIQKLYDETGKLEKTFGRKLSDDELKLFDDIAKGKIKPDANSFESSVQMIKKLEQSELDLIKGAIKPLEELEGPSRTAVINKMNDKWSTSKKAMAAIGTTGAFAWGLGVWLPDKLNGWGQFGLTNAAEMSALFSQFDKDTSAERLLELWFPTGGRETAMTQWLKSAKTYIGWMETIYSIPIIGDWYKSMTLVGYTSAIGSLGNLDTKMTELKNRGLAVKDSSALSGWRETTQEEKDEIYKNDPKALFANDADYVNKQMGDKKTGIFGKGKSGKELTKAQVMALYYADRGENDVSISKFGLTSSDLNDESLMIEVRKYGKAHDKSTDTTENEATKYSLTEMAAMGLTCDMGKTCTQETYNKNIKNGWFVYKDELTGKAIWGQPGDKVNENAILDKGIRDTVGSGLTGTTGGASYIKKSGSATPSIQQQQSLTQVKKGEKTLDYNDVEALKKDGKVDIKQAKENGIEISDLAAKDREATVGGFEQYAKEMVKEEKIDKNDYTAMKKEDAAATRAAIRKAAGCDE